MHVEAIPIFSDNYVWCLRADAASAEAWVVDPGDAAPVLAALAARGCRLGGILVTHWHPDHIGGIPALLETAKVEVYGPLAEQARIPSLSRPLVDGDSVRLPWAEAEVLALPGHTLGHIAYALPGWLFCGDTLFSAGCGRLFEGSPADMWASLQRLDAYPPDTRIACTHEYTLSNLRFALAVEPGNAAIADYRRQVEAWRAQGQPSLPSTLARERQINPFLRSREPAVRAAAERASGMPCDSPEKVFAALRAWKDRA
jgi:hydroxyacylglutathione hydrolase